jgi:limonene-1,2-epoxide hydrolase
MTNSEVVLAFCSAWESRDVARLMAFIHPAAVYHNMPRPPLRGAATIREALAGLIGQAQAVRFIVSHIAETADGVVLTERIDRITYEAGDADVLTMGVFELTDGLISAWRDYYDEGLVAAAIAAARTGRPAAEAVN